MNRRRLLLLGILSLVLGRRAPRKAQRDNKYSFKIVDGWILRDDDLS